MICGARALEIADFAIARARSSKKDLIRRGVDSIMQFQSPPGDDSFAHIFVNAHTGWFAVEPQLYAIEFAQVHLPSILCAHSRAA